MRVQNYDIKGSGFFNGTNSVISFNAIGATLGAYLNGTSGLTWAGWIRPTADSGSNQVIFSVSNSTGVVCNAFISTGTGQLNTQGRANAEATITITTSFRAINYGAWYHVVAVQDYANNQQRLYLNGVKVRTGTNAYSQNTLNIGTAQAGVGASPSATFFQGKIADGVKLIRGAVTDDEAYALYIYNQNPSGKPVAINVNPSEGYLASITDNSGNGHTGVPTSVSWSSDSPLKPKPVATHSRLSARFIAGSSNRVNTTNNIAVDSFTFSTWYNAGSIVAGTYTLFSGLLADMPKLTIDSSDRLELTRVSTGATATTGTVINRNSVWQHIAVTYDTTTGLAKFFINGCKCYEASATGTYSASGQVRIGGDEASSNYLSGRVKEMAYWSRALSEDEVMNVFKFTPKVARTNQEFYYPFNYSITSQDIPDQSPSNNDGLHTSAPTYDAVGNSYTARVSAIKDTGISGKFDGSASTVVVASGTVSARLAGATGITISAWVRPILTATQQNMIFIANSGGATGAAILISASNNFTSTWRSRTGGTATGAGGATRHITNNAWQHYVATVDFVNKEAFAYVNGEIVGRATAAWEDDSYQCGDGQLVIAAAATRFLGNMNDPRVYRKNLSHNEVKLLFQGAEPQRANLVYQGKFVDGTNTTVYDVSGYSATPANGTATSLTYTQDTPF